MIEQVEAASSRHVSRETFIRLERYVSLLLRENEQQNLISRSSVKHVWERHILDSAQLCRHSDRNGEWLDIGAGAGLPGIVIAILTDQPITLCEPRRLRAEFLRQCVTELSLSKVTVLGDKIERLQGKTFDFITARAVASLGTLFDLAFPLSRPDTRWILPKGRSGAKELAEAQRSWQGRFRTVPSITDGQAVIVVAEQVEPRAGLKGGAKR